MAKGYRGQSCAEAIRVSFEPGEVVPFSRLYQRVKRRGDWKDSTIWQHLMALVVNLPPARHYWKSSRPFLFLHPDGRYEIYNPDKHPKPVE